MKLIEKKKKIILMKMKTKETLLLKQMKKTKNEL